MTIAGKEYIIYSSKNKGEAQKVTNKDEPIEKIIAKAIEERYGSSPEQKSESSADRSVYHISDEVYYTQSQADNAYRRAQKQADSDAEVQRHQLQESGRSSGSSSKKKASKSSSGADKAKKKKSAKKSSQKSGGRHNSNEAKHTKRYKVSEKGKTKMDAYDDEIYEDGDVELEEKPPKRKFHPIRTLIKLLLVLTVIAFAAYSLISLYYINMVDIQPEGERVSTGAELFDSKGVRNILLIGTDSRGDDRGRADTVILMSINWRSRTITLTSFMRDSYVDIPGHGKNKLNASYRWGGAELLMDTLQQNFRVPIDDYVCVDFESFSDIVDAVGGIDLTVTTDEAIAMQAPMGEVNKLTGRPKGTDYLSTGGTYHMNGNQALAYARIRYVGRSDFQRTERQREVIQKIFARAKKLGLSDLNTFASTCAKSVKTNMSKGEMYVLSLQLVYFATFDVEELRVPMDDAYTSGKTPEGQSVLIVDFDKNIAEIEDMIYS